MSLINLIKEYVPYNEQEEKDKGLILKYLEIFDDILTRKNELIQITSSGFVINKYRDKTLMVHHNIYNSWSWTGGHADGEENLLIVAIKELEEETGVKSILPVTNKIFSLDILPVIGHMKNGRYVSAHLHISIAYLFEVDEKEKLIIKPDENSNVGWIPINEIDHYSNEVHMKIVYNKIISKIKELSI